MNENQAENLQEKKGRSYILTLLLSMFLGGLGIHRFYTGYVIIGIIQLISVGGFGVWALIDLVSIALNKYKDADGRELVNHNAGCGLMVLIFLIATFMFGGISSLLSLFSISR